ncbi:MAG: hypothetical protein GKR99_18610 [Rhodobacteraceae bacterium]|nr:hypothetical protein [Paracoccaceae bacterium]
MTVRVAFTDFWGSFKPETNLFTKLMRRHASIKVVTERPDLCFFSNFGRKPYRPDGHFAFMGEDCIKVFFTGENISADCVEKLRNQSVADFLRKPMKRNSRKALTTRQRMAARERM